jgi:hypothetical protein
MPSFLKSRARARAALLPLIAACAVSGAAAASDQGWYVALDLALAQPALEQDYALQIDTTGSPVETTRHVFDGDTDVAFRFGFGYGFGPDRGDLRVTWWSFDGGDGTARGMNGYVEPLVFGDGYYGPYYDLYDAGGVETDASTDVTAMTVDLDYSRGITHGRRFRLSWLAGLRYAGYEETREFKGDDTIIAIQQEKVIDSDALGLRAGAEAEYGFGRRFTLTGKATISLLRSKSTASAGQEIFDAPSGTLLVSETSTVSSDSGHGHIVDAGVSGVWRLKQTDIVLGLEYAQWSGLVEDPIPAEEAHARDTVSFTSVYLGMRYWFKERAQSSSGP